MIISSRARRWSVAAALCFAPMVSPLAAQGARGEGVGPGGTFPYMNVYISVGASYVNTRDLNGRLDTAKYYAVSNDGISIGGGARMRFGRAIFGGEYAYTDFGEEGDPTKGLNSRLTSGYWMVQYGYAWWAGRHLNIYPMLGAGMGSANVMLENRSGGGAPPAGVDPTFTEIVLHPNTRSTVRANYWVLEPGVGADWMVLRSVGDRMGMTFGARFGKRISPNRAAWKLGDRKVIGGPDVGPDGPFFRLTVGLGWR